MSVYINKQYAYDVRTGTVMVSGRPLKSPAGHGATMIDANDAAFAMLQSTFSTRQACDLFIDFGIHLSSKALNGRKVIVMSQDEIKAWAAAVRFKARTIA